MDNPQITLTLAITVLAGIAMLAVVSLKGFTVWIDLKRAELSHDSGRNIASSGGSSRIEIADLKERIRKLEAIAAGVDL